MDFLLECIGFPPDHDAERLVELARRSGERAPWRGPDGEHWRLALGAGLELRVDRDDRESPWNVYPSFQSEHRLRIALESVRSLPDSRCDALVTGWANPPLSGPPSAARDAYPLTAVLNDARRIPRDILRGHVLAVSLAGFALDVESIADTEFPGASDDRAFPDGGWIRPLGGVDDPGGCVELALRVVEAKTLFNPLTNAAVTMLAANAPGRPLVLFTSPWQLESARLAPPRVGSYVRGVFLLTGRISGGLRSVTERLGRDFG